MSLFDPDDPIEWTRIVGPLIRHGGTISDTDAQRLVESVVGRSVDGDSVEDALRHAGYEDDGDDAGLWRLRKVPITGTGDEDSFSYGGGVLIYDTVDGLFTWYWWPEPEEDDTVDVDDDEDPPLMYEVRWFTFNIDDRLTDAEVTDAEMRAIASYTGTDMDELRERADSASVIDVLWFLEELVSTIGANRLDDSPVFWSGAEITQHMGPQTDIVARRSRQEVDDLVARLRGAGASAPDEGSDLPHLLGQINARRRELGMRDLDPAAAGWSDDDIRIEAQRLREGNPPSDAYAELLWW